MMVSLSDHKIQEPPEKTVIAGTRNEIERKSMKLISKVSGYTLQSRALMQISKIVFSEVPSFVHFCKNQISLFDVE